MRKMKTMMDVQIRQTNTRSFQGGDQAIRQTASRGMSSASVLRQEVLSELPNQYRKVLASMSPRQQERLLLKVEASVNRKVSSGAMARTAARLDERDRREIQRLAQNTSGSRDAQRRLIAEKYRLPAINQRAGPDDTFLSVPADSPQMRQYIEDMVRRESERQRQERQRPEPAVRQCAKASYIGEMGRREAARNNKKLPVSQSDNTSKNIDINHDYISTYFDDINPPSSTSKNTLSVLTDATLNIQGRNKAEGTKMQAAKTQYQQSLLSSAKSGRERQQIESAMRKAVAGNAGRKEQILLRNANQKAAYSARNTTNAYREMLAEAGIRTDGQKAAVQMAYEKQVKASLKNTYRKELIGSLAKQKTSALMRKAEQKRYQREREQENELNRTMSDQTRSAFGIMSKTGKFFRKIADGTAKAIRGLVNKKMLWLIIPVLLVAAVPFVMTALPLISMVSSNAYEDNEVYAYADASELIAYAQQWIGKIPYVWGGGHGGSATAWQSGCDCSGFVHGVFNHFGYEIGGDTGAMETQAGTHIAYDSLADAKPGDVIIYYRTGAHVKGDPNGSGSTHVSIYEGNNKIIHQAGGVHESTEYHQYFEVRRVLTADVAGRGNISGGLGGMGTYGHKTDATKYSQSDLELIWAIVAQEDNGSYKGALAVISSAMNRVESPTWSYEGSNALAQLTAPGQYCYSNDTYWQARLGGNVPDYVKQAVNDCLKKGKRNHNYTSFRSTKGKTTGADAVQIGGNWFFGH